MFAGIVAAASNWERVTELMRFALTTNRRPPSRVSTVKICPSRTLPPVIVFAAARLWPAPHLATGDSLSGREFMASDRERTRDDGRVYVLMTQGRVEDRVGALLAESRAYEQQFNVGYCARP